MVKVRRLPQSLVSKIAAGEVIERPSSVVKELIENSIDAGANRIDVHLSKGGIRYIRVIDDGEGMGREDALLSLERHATSKINAEEDLLSIITMGFRGEALPSITSVSETVMVTKEKGKGSGTKIVVKGGVIESVEDIGAPDGTSIEVFNIFFNLPARKKFLRSPSTELGHIIDTIYRYAFSHPYMDFKVLQDGKLLLNMPKCDDIRKRVLYTFGKEAYNDLVCIEGEIDAYRIQGWTSLLDYTLPNRKGIFIYVNCRWVRDRTINHALLESLRPALPRDRFPLSIIHLYLPTDRIDVNVHPSKIEVRFKEPQMVYNLVKSSVEEGIKGLFSKVTRGSADYSIDKGDGIYKWGTQEIVKETDNKYTLTNYKNAVLYDREDLKIFSRDTRIIGQLWGEYLVCEEGDRMILIDQHAAHERIVFERLKREYSEEGLLRSEPLLLPQIIKLSPKETVCLEESIQDIKRFGFEIEPFGRNEIVVKSLPSLLSGVDSVSWVRDIINQSLSTKGSLVSSAVDKVLMTMACHSVVRGDTHLSEKEIDSLLTGLRDTDGSYTCPHGRPVIKVFEKKDIEVFFRRR